MAKVEYNIISKSNYYLIVRSVYTIKKRYWFFRKKEYLSHSIFSGLKCFQGGKYKFTMADENMDLDNISVENIQLNLPAISKAFESNRYHNYETQSIKVLFDRVGIISDSCKFVNKESAINLLQHLVEIEKRSQANYFKVIYYETVYE